MRRIQDPNLAQLLMTLRFLPETKRRQQLLAAERLVSLIEPERHYPYHFVIFKITGFTPKDPQSDYLIPGDRLLADLTQFIVQLSSRDVPSTEESGSIVYRLEEAAARLGVSTKTLQRWRRRGLVAQKFRFPDGVKRLGVSQAALDRFLQAHPRQADRARHFQRLSPTERQAILDRLVQLAQLPHRTRHRVIQEVARQTGRARETIRLLLQDFEKTPAGRRLFPRKPGGLHPSEAAELHSQYRQGVPVAALMQRFHRSRSSIYRIINQRRASLLLARRIRYVHSVEFDSADTVAAILAEPLPLPRSTASLGVATFHSQGESVLPEYLQAIQDAPEFSRPQETALFRKYNCLKFKAVQRRKGIDRTRPCSTLLSEVEAYLNEAETIEQVIVQAHLRLVVSIARKHAGAGPHFAELVSKGNYALIKAIQEFDYTAGFHFSKRAALTIAKEYARVSGRSTELSRRHAESLASIHRDLRETADSGVLERTHRHLLDVIRKELTEREQYVIVHHFGLADTGPRRRTKTLKAIGEELGLTKERIRQIELMALQKLRQCLSHEEFEHLTG